eukprot:Hpha_TRINITY_DN16349_c7_g2::TRINITY_DN16349_c7_g2_i1::g.61463::m.61463
MLWWASAYQRLPGIVRRAAAGTLPWRDAPVNSLSFLHRQMQFREQYILVQLLLRLSECVKNGEDVVQYWLRELADGVDDLGVALAETRIMGSAIEFASNADESFASTFRAMLTVEGLRLFKTSEVHVRLQYARVRDLVRAHQEWREFVADLGRDLDDFGVALKGN